MFSVLKRVDRVGYIQLPPDALQFELGGAGNVTGTIAAKQVVLAGLTLGLAAIAELHEPGSGDDVFESGQSVSNEILEDDLEALNALVRADPTLRARTRALRRFMELAELVGTTRASGYDTWYLVADNPGLEVPISTPSANPQSQAVEGHMVVDRMEVWVDRNESRPVALNLPVMEPRMLISVPWWAMKSRHGAASREIWKGSTSVYQDRSLFSNHGRTTGQCAAIA
jgi:hypothetical protein